MKSPVEVDAMGKPTLDAVLYAFVEPIVRRGIGSSRAPGTLRLLREYVAMSVHTISTNAPESFAGVANRWLTAIMEARPGLQRARAVWLMSFVVMVTFNEQMQHGWYDDLLPPGSQITAEELTRMIVAFCRAGIDAVGMDGETSQVTAA